MKSSQFSALARPLDISYRSNLVIMFLNFFILLIAFFYQWWHLDTEFWESLWWGVQASLSVFFAWALGREIDPDVNTTAFLATPFSLAIFYLSGSFAWLLLLAFLMMLRVTSHICGQSVKLTDAILCLGLVAYLCWQGHFLIGFAFTAAFFVDSRLSPAHKTSQWYALISLIITIVALVIFPLNIATERFPFSWWWIGGVAIASLIFMGIIRAYKRPHSTEDYKVQGLNGSRMQAAQIIVLLSLLLMFALQSYTSMFEIAPLWMVIISADLLFIYRTLTRRPRY